MTAARSDLMAAIRCVDEADLAYLMTCLNDSGRGRFWKNVVSTWRAALLSGAGTKSAPCFKASHNSGERDPSVMPDCRGADTKSDGRTRDSLPSGENEPVVTRACGPSDPSPGPDVSLPVPIADNSEAGTRPCEFCGSTDTADSKSHCEACAHAAPVGEPVAFITKSGFKNWLQGDGPENHVLLRTGGDLRVALYTHPVAWECVAQRQSLPEPADCDWPVCGCDPHANKVIESLEEQGVLSTHPPAPAVGPDVREVVAYQMVGEFASPDFPSVNITPYKHVANLWRQAGAEVRELYALTRPLGGFVQGSIATKQSSSSTPATATETSIDALEPWRDELAEIVGHLGAAIIQSTTSDDQIIMDHVKAAHEIAKIVRRKA